MTESGVDTTRFRLRTDLPAHRQVAAYFKTLIALGHLAPGGELPGLGALASRFGVATAVIRRAFDELAERGLLQGKGGRWSVARGEAEREVADLLREAAAEARRAGIGPERFRELFERALRQE